VRALFERAVSEFGGVDGLFNVGADLSPGTIGRDGDLLEMDAAIWRRTFEVNLIGYAHTCRAAIPLLLEGGGGAIVNTSSLAAFAGEPLRPARGGLPAVRRRRVDQRPDLVRRRRRGFAGLINRRPFPV
jgi:NAD(P)-dependent dehydrogenase (short-subunit alcohol dehydrogenase family)